MARRVLGVAIVLSTVATPLSARQTTEELLDRIEALTPQVERAAVAARESVERKRGDLARAPGVPVDTFRVGPVRVVALPDQRNLALQVFGEALDHFGPWLDETDAFEDDLVTFQWAYDAVQIHMEGQHWRVEASRDRSRDDMVRSAVTAIGSIVSIAAGESGLRGWFAGPVAEPRAPESIYRVLASFPAEANRRCLDEGGRACLAALGADLDDFPYDDWYTAEERRRIVGTHHYMSRRDRIADTEEGRLLAACVDAGSMEACDRFLDEVVYSPRSVAPLGHDDARPLLVYLALQAGGDGAWERLVADPDMSVAAALEAASGLPAEELADRWHAYVVARRPAAQAGLGGTALITVLTILTCVALATRSTKWRLG